MLTSKYSPIFGSINGNEALETNVRAEIRTSTVDPKKSQKSIPPKAYLLELGRIKLKAFNTLKQLLISPEILAFPNFGKPFILAMEAIGAVLSQAESGKNRPITYILRSPN